MSGARYEVQGTRFEVQGPGVGVRPEACNLKPATCLVALTRPRLSAMVAVSALAGYALHPAPLGRPLLLTAGVFLLAAGCTALNQVQERDLDARMERTRRRPLPAGLLPPWAALLIALILGGSGLATLAAGGWIPLLLGLAAVLFYNGIYTPLKPRTLVAVLPGAIAGALPPLIGWTAAGGSPTAHPAILLSGLILLWQIPHFWLFAERNREDYRRAGLPMLDTLFTPAQIRRLVFAWCAALASAVLPLSLFALGRSSMAGAATLLCALFLFAFAVDARSRYDRAPGPLFRRLTGGMAVVLAAILIGRWLVP